MVLVLSESRTSANRSEPRRINAMRHVHQLKPDSSGLDPATQPRRVCAANDSDIESFEQIVPIWVYLLDQRDLPFAFPALDVGLPLNGIDIERMALEPNQPRH